MKEKRKVFLLALPCAITLLAAFIIPMVYTFIKALLTDNLTYYTKFFTDPFYLKIFKNTAVLSVKTTVLTLLLGYPTAYFIARTKSKIKRVPYNSDHIPVPCQRGHQGVRMDGNTGRFGTFKPDTYEMEHYRGSY